MYDIRCDEKGENLKGYKIGDFKRQTVEETDENGDTIIPDIQNGYYYFYDRHSESTEPYNDEDVLSRASFNFTLALYDSDNNVLYYVEFDT